MSRLSNVVVAFAITLIVCIYVEWVISQPAESPRSFDKIVWEEARLDASSNNDPGCFRGGMALDLINRKALLGRTSSEVLSMLATPENSSPSFWFYPVGQCGLLWGHHDLKVTFGTNGKVEHAALSDSI